MARLALALWLLAVPALSAAAEVPPPDLAAVGVVVGASPERSVAILQSGGRTRAAAVGGRAFGGRVTRVTRGQVELEYDGRRVELPLTRGAEIPRAPQSAPDAGPAAPPPGEAMGALAESRRRTLDRAEVERRIAAEMNRLIRAALRPVTEDGRVIGMRVSQIPDGTILQEVGLRSGDVITDLNGVRVDGLPALIGLWSSLQGASELRATVLRDGVIVGLDVALR